MDGILPPPSPQPLQAGGLAAGPTSPPALGMGGGQSKKTKRSRGSRSRSNSSAEAKRTKGRGRHGETRDERASRRLEVHGVRGQSIPIILNVPADAMAPAQLPPAASNAQDQARSVVISKTGFHVQPASRRGRPHASGMRKVGTSNSPPQSLEQRLRALDPATQQQWLERMDAERTGAGLNVKDGAGGADRGSSPSVPARL